MDTKTRSATITTLTDGSPKPRYVECREADIPNGVRFDVPRHKQGQIVEYAYGGFCRSEHAHGDPYMRRTDKSDRSVTYYRWQD